MRGAKGKQAPLVFLALATTCGRYSEGRIVVQPIF